MLPGSPAPDHALKRVAGLIPDGAGRAAGTSGCVQSDYSGPQAGMDCSAGIITASADGQNGQPDELAGGLYGQIPPRSAEARDRGYEPRPNAHRGSLG